MPAATTYSTREAQEKFMHGIQDVIVNSSYAMQNWKSIFGLFVVAWDIIQVARRIRKLGEPTHNLVNKHNSHIMIEWRDWFVAHDTSSRRVFYRLFFNFMIEKYEFDNHMGRRLEKILEKWYEYAQEERWVFTHKHPETDWILTEEEKKEPTAVRYAALREALDNKEWAKVLNLVE